MGVGDAADVIEQESIGVRKRKGRGKAGGAWGLALRSCSKEPKDVEGDCYVWGLRKNLRGTRHGKGEREFRVARGGNRKPGAELACGGMRTGEGKGGETGECGGGG